MSIIRSGPAAPPNQQSQYTRVFYEDWESYSVGPLPTGRWSQDVPHPMPQIVTTAVDGGSAKYSGTKGMEANWDGSGSPKVYSCAKLDTFTYTVEFLIRLRIRYETDCDRNLGAKVFRLTTGVGGSQPGSNSFYCGGQLEDISTPGDLFSYFEETNGVQGTNGGYPYTNSDLSYGVGYPFADGNWHKLEVYVKQSDSGAGAHRVWYDGHLALQKTGLTDLTAYKWYPMYLMSNWSQNVQDSANHVLWDEIEIFSDSNTGTACSGVLSDASVAIL